MKSLRPSLVVPAVILVGFAVVLLLTDGASRGVAEPKDVHVLFADSLFTWSTATDVVPQVNGQATPHPEMNSWTYTYTVRNDVSSTTAIMTFALAPVLEPESTGSPAHWYQTHGFADQADATVWTVVDAGPPPVDWDSVSVYPSPFEIQPGDSVSSFSIVSPHSPGMITYYVQGYYDLALEPDEPDPPSLFGNSVSGTVVGPAGTAGVDDTPFRSGSVALRAPVPNPARGSVSVTFYLPDASHVVLAVYDVAGRRVRVLVDGDWPSGVHSSSWNGLDENGRRVSAGVYFYQLLVGGKAAGTRRAVIVP